MTASFDANFFPHKNSLSGPKRWKSDGAKSGLYGGCGNASHFSLCSISSAKATVRGRALSWRKQTEDCAILLFERIAGCTSYSKILHNIQRLYFFVLWGSRWTVFLYNPRKMFIGFCLLRLFFFRFSRRRWSRITPLFTLSFGFRNKIMYQCFITGYYAIQKLISIPFKSL